MDDADGCSAVTAPVLVIGANGYLGSHVTRQLVAAGHDVRVMVRDGANTIGIDDLAVTRYVGDIWDSAVLRTAMTGARDRRTASSIAAFEMCDTSTMIPSRFISAMTSSTDSLGPSGACGASARRSEGWA